MLLRVPGVCVQEPRAVSFLNSGMGCLCPAAPSSGFLSALRLLVRSTLDHTHKSWHRARSPLRFPAGAQDVYGFLSSARRSPAGGDGTIASRLPGRSIRFWAAGAQSRTRRGRYRAASRAEKPGLRRLVGHGAGLERFRAGAPMPVGECRVCAADTGGSASALACGQRARQPRCSVHGTRRCRMAVTCSRVPGSAAGRGCGTAKHALRLE